MTRIKNYIHTTVRSLFSTTCGSTTCALIALSNWLGICCVCGLGKGFHSYSHRIIGVNVKMLVFILPQYQKGIFILVCFSSLLTVRLKKRYAVALTFISQCWNHTSQIWTKKIDRTLVGKSFLNKCLKTVYFSFNLYDCIDIFEHRWLLQLQLQDLINEDRIAMNENEVI